VRHPALGDVQLRAPQLFLRDLLADGRLHQRRSGGEHRGALHHHDEIHQQRGEYTMASRCSHDERHGWDDARELGQELQIVWRVGVTLKGVGDALPRAFEQHDQRRPLL
jgi:hypothetical protein